MTMVVVQFLNWPAKLVSKQGLVGMLSPNTCIYSWILKISISDENEMQKLQITHKKRFLQLLELFVIFL